MRKSTLGWPAAVGLAIAAACAATPSIAAPKAAPAKCVAKAGTASGPTRDFAEYEALLIIRQVTGNWPIESDRITDVKYTCKQSGMWTCVAHAKVCKS